jgi:hypothetical protein
MIVKLCENPGRPITSWANTPRTRLRRLLLMRTRCWLEGDQCLGDSKLTPR